MIKWLKKLVKGSDFVVTKKKISVIALDPRAGKSYGEDIAGLFPMWRIFPSFPCWTAAPQAFWNGRICL